MSKKTGKKINVWMFESEDMQLVLEDEPCSCGDPVEVDEAVARRWQKARDAWGDAVAEMYEAYETMRTLRAEAQRKAAAP